MKRYTVQSGYSLTHGGYIYKPGDEIGAEAFADASFPERLVSEGLLAEVSGGGASTRSAADGEGEKRPRKSKKSGGGE